MKKRDVFSGAVILAKGNKVILQEAYGYASKRFEAKNKIDTKFNLASMNKMFTSIAILQLAEAEKFLWMSHIQCMYPRSGLQKMYLKR